VAPAIREPSRALLLLIDLQRAFCDPDGSIAAQGRPIETMRTAARCCQALAVQARTTGVPVAWTRLMLKPDYSDGGMITRLRPGLMKVGALRAGTPDVELSSLVAAEPDDLIIDKPRHSSLYKTRFEEILRARRIDRVIVGGVTTSMCVETTVRDIAQRDYEVVVIEEACADFDAPRHAASLAAMAFGFAHVLPMHTAASLFAGEPLPPAG
jgi:nicotinamidase-related amidase